MWFLFLLFLGVEIWVLIDFCEFYLLIVDKDNYVWFIGELMESSKVIGGIVDIYTYIYI